jgi:hypothetical protein
MAVITEIDLSHPIGEPLYIALANIRRDLAVVAMYEPLRSEARGVSEAEVTRVLGVTKEPGAFSDRMAKIKVATTTLAEFREFVSLCTPAAEVA